LLGFEYIYHPRCGCEINSIDDEQVLWCFFYYGLDEVFRDGAGINYPGGDFPGKLLADKWAGSIVTFERIADANNERPRTTQLVQLFKKPLLIAHKNCTAAEDCANVSAPLLMNSTRLQADTDLAFALGAQDSHEIACLGRCISLPPNILRLGKQLAALGNQQ